MTRTTPSSERKRLAACGVPPRDRSQHDRGRERRAQPELRRFDSTAHDDVSPLPSFASAMHPAVAGQLK
jgi:hypothetical protein